MIDRTASPLTDLIAEGTAIRSRARDGLGAATAFAGLLSRFTRAHPRPPEWLRQTSSDAYVQRVIHVSAAGDFSIVALAWAPGGCTPIHDHLSWCAVSVWEGQEHETCYRRCDDGRGIALVEMSQRLLVPGDTTALEADGHDVHRVQNSGSTVAISLHIYGIDVRRAGTSIKSRYDETALAREHR